MHKMTLHVIGAGKVGQTLAYCLARSAAVQIGNIFARDSARGYAAQQFIGQGQVVEHYAELTPADLYMLTVSDDHIAAVAQQLAQQHTLPAHAIVFHCSGALPARVLQPLLEQGARGVSVHPALSFAIPAQAVQELAGAYCTLEGDASACTRLIDLLTAVGLQCRAITAEHKLLYHAAVVLGSNYVVALLDSATLLLQQLGFEPDEALGLLRGLTTPVVERSLSEGTALALTGPIARGDERLVVQQLQALIQHDSGLADLYRVLGGVAVDLAQRAALLDADKSQRLRQVLSANK